MSKSQRRRLTDAVRKAEKMKPPRGESRRWPKVQSADGTLIQFYCPYVAPPYLATGELIDVNGWRALPIIAYPMTIQADPNDARAYRIIPDWNDYVYIISNSNGRMAKGLVWATKINDGLYAFVHTSGGEPITVHGEAVCDYSGSPPDDIGYYGDQRVGIGQVKLLRGFIDIGGAGVMGLSNGDGITYQAGDLFCRFPGIWLVNYSCQVTATGQLYREIATGVPSNNVTSQTSGHTHLMQQHTHNTFKPAKLGAKLGLIVDHGDLPGAVSTDLFWDSAFGTVWGGTDGDGADVVTINGSSLIKWDGAEFADIRWRRVCLGLYCSGGGGFYNPNNDSAVAPRLRPVSWKITIHGPLQPNSYYSDTNIGTDEYPITGGYQWYGNSDQPVQLDVDGNAF